MFADTLALLAAVVRERQIELLVLSDREEALALAHTPIRLPSGVARVAVADRHGGGSAAVLSHLTRARGFDTEAPRGLNKITLTH